MLIALDLSTVRNFTSKYDTGQSKTIFKIGVVDSITRAKIEDDEYEFTVNKTFSIQDGGMIINRRQRNLQVVRHGLKGWENFKDASGSDVPFQTAPLAGSEGTPRTIVSESSLKLLDPRLIDELADEISRANVMTKEEEKN